MSRIAVLVSSAAGLLFGGFMHIYAHSGNGWEVGPGILVFTALVALIGGASFIGAVVSRRRRRVASALLLFSLVAYLTFLLLATVRPYPEPPGPVPLVDLPRAQVTGAEGIPERNRSND
jgi:hypothetical protein